MGTSVRSPFAAQHRRNQLPPGTVWESARARGEGVVSPEEYSEEVVVRPARLYAPDAAHTGDKQRIRSPFVLYNDHVEGKTT